MRTVEQEALDLAARLGRLRLRDELAANLLERQDATLEPLDDEKPSTLMFVVAMVAVLAAGLIWISLSESLDGPPTVDAPAPARGVSPQPHGPGAALLSSVDEMGARLLASRFSVRELEQYRVTLDSLGRARR